MVFDRARDEDDALLQEARIDVIGPLAAVGLLDHHGHQGVQIDMAQIFHGCSEGPDGPETSTWGPLCESSRSPRYYISHAPSR